MGRAKAMLPFGPEVMLQRVVRILREIVEPVVVVAAPDQELPALPEAVRIARDEREYLGPLAGMGVGLRALAAEVEAAYCSSCDVPLLRPAFVRAVIDRLQDNEAAVPREAEFWHPLAGVYRASLVQRIDTLIAAERLRPVFLIESIHCASIEVDELRHADPSLASLRNVNTPDEYAAALQAAGLP